MSPHEVRFALDKRLLSLAGERALVPLIVGVHSTVMIDDATVSVIFDIVPDDNGNGLHFEFTLPREVNRDDIRAFSAWLACSGRDGEMLH